MRSSRKPTPKWAELLNGSQKLFAIVAVILTLLILLNPEFLALGLLGDAAFFDLMVLALTLQMHAFAARAFQTCLTGLSRGIRWLGIPSPGLLYLIGISTFAFRYAASAIQKIMVRILS
jgi:hypothetical protein